MVESAAYELIKNEGRQQGIQEGIQRGLQEETQQKARAAIFEDHEVRFGVVPRSIAAAVNSITELAVLKALHRKCITVESLEEYQEVLQAGGCWRLSFRVARREPTAPRE